MPPDATPVAPPPPAVKPNGAAPPPPADGKPPIEGATTPPPTSAEDKRMAELLAQEKKVTQARMQGAQERKAELERIAKERESYAKDKADLEAWKAEREDRRRNPKKYLQRDFGENWRDEVARVAIEDGPTVGMVQSEVSDSYGKLKKEFEDYKASIEEKFTQKEREAAERSMHGYLNQAKAYVKAQKEQYPLVHAFGLVDNVALVIQGHLKETEGEDESGNYVPGELLTFEEASKRMEAHLKEKYEAAAKLTAAKPDASKAGEVKTRPPDSTRKTLTQQLSGNLSQSQTQKPETEGERRRRAIAAGEAAAAKRKEQGG